MRGVFPARTVMRHVIRVIAVSRVSLRSAVLVWTVCSVCYVRRSTPRSVRRAIAVSPVIRVRTVIRVRSV